MANFENYNAPFGASLTENGDTGGETFKRPDALMTG